MHVFLFQFIADNATFRYRRGPLIDVVLHFLESRNGNVRELEMTPQHPGWMRVRSFLKGVKVEVQNVKRKLIIADLEPRAGRYIFTKDERQIDVEVGASFSK